MSHFLPTSRRHFLRNTAAVGVSSALPSKLFAQMQNHADMPGMDHKPAHPAMSMRQHPPAPPSIPLLNVFSLPAFVDALPIPPRAETVMGHGANAAKMFRVHMREVHAQVHRDVPATRLWSYGKDAQGPTIEGRSGEAMQVDWVNELPHKHFLPVDHTLHGCGAGVPEVRAVVHLHGARTKTVDDGYPEDWYTPGHSRVCHYPNPQDAAHLWYHDHAMGINRLNIYAGLFGQCLLRDAHEDSLHLPSGEYEIPLALYDRNFTRDGQLYYPVSIDPKSPWVPEVFGDAILVNGKIRPYLEVEPRQYRFRVLNAANGRFFSLSLGAAGKNVPLLVQIGSDQGLLAWPVTHTRPLVIAPAERVDLLIDFSEHRGEVVRLKNAALEIVEFRVKGTAAQKPAALPASLRPIERTQEHSAVRTRQITLHEYDDDYGKSMVMLLNRKHWHEPVTEIAKLNTTEIWEFVNLTEDTHPMHMHLVRFQVLDRRPFDQFAFLMQKQLKFTGEAHAPNPQEMGWKDTVQCSPLEVTRVIVKFEGFAGKYLYHCHILEHESNDMMRPLEVIA